MTDKTFEDYKQEMREYLLQYGKEMEGKINAGDVTTDKRDIAALLDNMRRTFPKKPEPSDRIAMCYAYFHRSTLLMEESYYKEWREQAKKYINEVPAEKHDNNLYFAIHVLEKTEQYGSPLNNLSYTEAAIKKMTKGEQKSPRAINMLNKTARKCYDAQMREIDKNTPPKTGEEYRKQIRRFDRLVDTLVKIPENARYREMNNMLPKMQRLYYMTEGGKIEFDGSHNERGKAAKIRHRVYISMSSDTKMHIRNQRHKEEWLCK